LPQFAARTHWSWRPNGPCIATISTDQLIQCSPHLVVLDANRFLPELAAAGGRVRYFAVGMHLRESVSTMTKVLEHRCAIITGASRAWVSRSPSNISKPVRA
jgi:hypothetical protein